MFETEALLLVAVIVILQLVGVDVIGAAGDWLTSQLGAELIPW